MVRVGEKKKRKLDIELYVRLCVRETAQEKTKGKIACIYTNERSKKYNYCASEHKKKKGMASGQWLLAA